MLSTVKTYWGRWLLLVAATAAAGAWASRADAAGLLVADGGFGGVLEIKDQDVHVTINNGVAVTEVDQTFVNKEQRIVEALYTFPVPKDASVSNFSMWIGGKEMIGEVVEKVRARQIYDSYKQTKRDPGLLEQVDYKRFEMRIFPIPAGGEQRVRITYYQELDFDSDQASYVYPLATVAVAGVKQNTTGRFSLLLDAKSEVPIVEMKSPSHNDQFVIVKHADPKYWQASFENNGADLSRDLVIDYGVERAHTGIDLITSKNSGEDGYFQLTMTAGKELETQLGGSDYVFVVDVSGSMMYDGKLALSRDAVGAFVQSLSDRDRFDLIAFNIAAKPLFSAPTPVNAETKEKATEFLRAQRAMGGTVLNPAIEAAYRYHDNDRQLNVVVLSDGMTEQGLQRELLQLIDRRPAGVSVFCIGVGNEVNRPLLAQLAGKTGGLATFVSTGSNFETQAQAFRRKLTRPAATGVKIALEGANVYDVEPEVLPNLYHGQPVRMYGRYKTAGPATIKVKAEVLGSPLEQSLAVTLPATEETNPEIERMWASHRVERLMAAGRAEGSSGHADEIVRLCEGYSIASQYASFIVLENDSEYQRWKIARRNATRVQRDRQAQLAVREGLAQLRRDTTGQVGPKSDRQAQLRGDMAGQIGRQANARPDPQLGKRGDSKQSESNATGQFDRPFGGQSDAQERAAGSAGKPALNLHFSQVRGRTESARAANARPDQTVDRYERASDEAAVEAERVDDTLDSQTPAGRALDAKADRMPSASAPAGDALSIEGPSSGAASEPTAASAPVVDATGGRSSGGGGPGGGAIDPLTALAAASLAALGWATRRRRGAGASVEV
ncbi:MAG TPA: VIT and VWA domain-containing protein [Pirellulales bacterium]|jgi:Ca-activated chloride channel family protein|nr:VIT and VWA domain-containing protein [Pirellulales bacterium]